MLPVPLRNAFRTWPVRAALLGLLGLWMNEPQVSLLGEESPEFLFGGWAGLVAFVWLGPAAGTLATLLSLGSSLVRLDGPGLATLAYLFEGLMARVLARRLGSLSLGVVVYWFGAGWLVDVVMYGGGLGLSADYLVLLFVKQVFNGALNALVAEVVLRALGAGPFVPGVALQQFIVSRVAFVGVLTSLPLGLFYARSVYREHLQLSRAQLQEATDRTVSALSRFLLGQQGPLGVLARSIEKDWLVVGPGRSDRLRPFHAGRPEYVNVGLADALGRVIDMSPSRNALGQPLDTGSIAGRGYFRQARDERRTAYAALILGLLHVRQEVGTEPILVIVEPLLDRQGAFAGALFAALDVGALRRLLVEQHGGGAFLPTLFDQQGRVIASLDPRLAPGMSLRGFLPLATGEPPLPHSFSYHPPPDASRAARLGLKLRHSSYESIELAGWGLVVDLPVESLHRDVARVAYRILLFFGGSLLLFYNVASRLTRGTRDSLLGIGSAAAATAGATADAAREIEGLSRSSIVEIQAVAGHFDTMLHAMEERKRVAASALAQSEERFRSAMHHSAIGMAIVAPEGRFLDVNPALCRIVGYTRDELLATDWQSITHPDSLAADLEYVRRILDGEIETYEMEKRYFHERGHVVWVLLSVSLVRDEAGLPRYFISQIQDITERRRVEEALRNSEQELAAVLATVPIGISVSTPGVPGTVTKVNPAGLRIFGYDSEEEFLRVPASAHYEDPEERRRFSELREQGPVRDLETRFRRKDGSVFWGSISGVARKGADGTVQFVNAFSDISERKRLEAERAQTEERLRQAQRLEAVGRLAGGVAHDFNNLLGVINGYAEMLLRGLDAGDQRRKRLEQILKAGERAASLTRQLLAFSRKQVLRPTVLDANEAVGATSKMLQRLIGEDVEVRFEPGVEAGRVRVDPGQLDEVLMNLGLNARDAMPGGGVLTIETERVELGADAVARSPELAPGPYVMVAVRDTGRGLDEAARARLFEPFFTTKEVGKGTGLGLATVYGIVKQSGGHVEVESEPGHGTTFRIYLPRLVEAAVGTGAASAPLPAAGGETVLVVEDDEAMRGVTVSLVESLGYRALAAGGAEEALALVARHAGPIDLLLTDVVMPRTSGAELARRLVERRPGLAVVYVSGHPDEALGRHGVLEGGVTLVAKPFTAEALSRALRERLDRRA